MFHRLNPWRRAAAVLGVAAGLALVGPPLRAQGLELGGNALALAPPEMKALSKLRLALSAPRPAQDAALEEARRVAQSRDARHVLALYELELGRQRKDDAMRAAALDVLIASDLTPKDKLPAFLMARGGIAYAQKDYAAANAMWTRSLELKPEDPDALANLAQAREAQKDLPGGAALLERAIAARKAAGQPVPERWYGQRMSLAYNARAARAGIAAARDLVTAFPTAQNWRQALVVYRQLALPRDEQEIDLFRLMRSAGALSQAAEYQRFAQLLEHGGRAAEAKAVIEEGRARTSLSAAESPTRDIIAEIEAAVPKERARLAGPRTSLTDADSLLAAGRQDEALLLYRGLLQKPGVDKGQANTRLGAALLAAGRRAEAEAAFRAAVASPGPYADLAGFWLARLAQP
jgi:tetratricopeptide (TPR) repeat protein